MRFGRAVIPVPDGRLLFGRDALARIGDGKADDVPLLAQADDDALVFARVVDGVADEVVDDLFHLFQVRLGVQLVVDLADDGIALRFGEVVEPLEHGVYQLRKVELAQLERVHARTDLGDVEDVVDEGGQAVGLVDDDLRVLGALFGVVARDLLDHGGVRLDHGQRRLQVVRDVGEHFLLQLVGLADLLFGVVERFGKGVHLRVGIFALEVDGKVARRHALGGLGDALHGAGQPHGQQRRDDQRQKDDDDADEDELHAHRAHGEPRKLGGIFDIEVDVVGRGGAQGYGQGARRSFIHRQRQRARASFPYRMRQGVRRPHRRTRTSFPTRYGKDACRRIAPFRQRHRRARGGDAGKVEVVAVAALHGIGEPGDAFRSFGQAPEHFQRRIELFFGRRGLRVVLGGVFLRERIQHVPLFIQQKDARGGVVRLLLIDVHVYLAVAVGHGRVPAQKGDEVVADRLHVFLRLGVEKHLQQRRLEHPGEQDDEGREHEEGDPQYEVDAVKMLVTGHASNLYPRPRRVTMNLRYSFRLLRSILMWVSTVRSSP